MNLFTQNSPYYNLIKYLLFLLKHPVHTTESQMKTYKCDKNSKRSSIVSFNNDTDGLMSGRQVTVRYYTEKWSHCVPFVSNKLRDKTHLRFSFDSPSYLLFAYPQILWTKSITKVERRCTTVTNKNRGQEIKSTVNWRNGSYYSIPNLSPSRLYTKNINTKHYNFYILIIIIIKM